MNRGPIKIGRVLLYLFLSAWALAVLIPFFMILVNSFKNMREAALFSLTLSPNSSLENYKTVLGKPFFIRGMKNSFIITTFAVVLVDILAAMSAFVIQRRSGRFAKALYFLYFAGLIVPMSIIPTIKLMMQTHIHNTYPGIILFQTAVNIPFSVFLLTGFMKSLPRELDEAAIIDGCGNLRLFCRIIAPLLVTPLITCTIVNTTGIWNDFQAPFYLISDSSKWPIVIGIFNFVTQYYTNWGLVFAFMTLVIVPVLVFYICLQKYIMSGLTAGSIKG
ncbi:MAG: carbohydrate ABC transporter permease [Treponema sp.]|jgi:raffinose/stachyose/melibiose transport system permease protein|nr:carbohydrate ABC transporter permease [Treponema sp.]